MANNQRLITAVMRLAVIAASIAFIGWVALWGIPTLKQQKAEMQTIIDTSKDQRIFNMGTNYEQ